MRKHLPSFGDCCVWSRHERSASDSVPGKSSPEVDAVNSGGLSRREFLRRGGLAAAAVAASGVISFRPDSARAKSPDQSTLSDYDQYDGVGLAARPWANRRPAL
jgi:hypothetical protein